MSAAYAEMGQKGGESRKDQMAEVRTVHSVPSVLWHSRHCLRQFLAQRSSLSQAVVVTTVVTETYMCELNIGWAQSFRESILGKSAVLFLQHGTTAIH